MADWHVGFEETKAKLGESHPFHVVHRNGTMFAGLYAPQPEDRPRRNDRRGERPATQPQGERAAKPARVDRGPRGPRRPKADAAPQTAAPDGSAPEGRAPEVSDSE